MRIRFIFIIFVNSFGVLLFCLKCFLVFDEVKTDGSHMDPVSSLADVALHEEASPVAGELPHAHRPLQGEVCG